MFYVNVEGTKGLGRRRDDLGVRTSEGRDM